MSPSQLIAAACRNIARRPLRNALAALGVMLGTASLVALLALASGAEAGALARLERRPMLHMVQVLPPAPHAGGPAVVLDAAAVERLARIGGVREAVPIAVVPGTLRLGVHQPSGSILGLSAERPPYALQAGRPLSAADEDAMVLSPAALRSLELAPGDAIGRTIALELQRGVERRELRFRVIGVSADDLPGHLAIVTLSRAEDAAAWIATGHDQAARDLRLAQEVAASLLFGGRAVRPDLTGSRYASIWLLAEPNADLRAIVRGVQASGYAGYAQTAAADAIAELFAYLRAVLAAVAAVALAVAALGIANALITSVSERTAEIGLLKAIGADDATVERLFLVEAALLGLAGSVGGVMLGWLGAAAAALVTARALTGPLALEPRVTVDLVAIALAIGVGVSLLAAWLPARRAARLVPADALRSD